MDLEDVLSASLDSTRAKLEAKTVRDARKIRYRAQGQGILLVVSGWFYFQLRIKSLHRNMDNWIVCILFSKVFTCQVLANLNSYN